MDLIKPFINARQELLNNSEPKDLISDVVFTIKFLNGKIFKSNTCFIHYEELLKYLDKEKAVQTVYNKIIDKTYFIENNFEYKDIDLVLFFSFDYLNFVDYCYIINLKKNNPLLHIYDLNGNLILEKILLEQRTDIDEKVINNESSTFYLFFDTETTGLPKNWKAAVTDLNNWPRIVQIAWILCDGKGNRIKSNNYIIKPENFIIPLDASRVHGISTEKAIKEGVSLEVVLNIFNGLVQKADYIIAHNINFDEKILGAEFIRKRIQSDFARKRKLCTMQSSTNYCKITGPNGYKWPKLSELHIKLFGIDFEEAHDASVDINATERCFWEMRKKGLI